MTRSSPAAARWALVANFLVHGILLGAWVPHIPLAKDRLDAGPAIFGLALLAFAGGAICAMPIAGVLINRFGSARLTLVSGLLFCFSFPGPILAPNLSSFILTGLIMGAGIGSMDVAMNAHGLATERALRRPIMSMLHGSFSVGGMAGTFLGAALLEIEGAGLQMLTVLAICLPTLIIASRFLLPGNVDKGLSGTQFAWPTPASLGLGLLCFLALMIEGSILDWAAIMMRETYRVEAGTAALGFGFYQAGMALARFSGDWIRQKAGAVPMVRVSALLTSAGTAAALTAPTPSLAILAFVIAGLGLGNIAPVLFAGGGRLEPDAPGRGIAAVTTLGYMGFLCGPPLIGLVAQLSSLTTALFITVAAALVIAVFASKVRPADRY